MKTPKNTGNSEKTTKPTAQDGRRATISERPDQSPGQKQSPAAGQPGPTELTADDWIEIFYALLTKKTAIDSNRYGNDATARLWSAHLDRIIDAIGIDGETAAARGTAATSNPTTR